MTAKKAANAVLVKSVGITCTEGGDSLLVGPGPELLRFRHQEPERRHPDA